MSEPGCNPWITERPPCGGVADSASALSEHKQNLTPKRLKRETPLQEHTLDRFFHAVPVLADIRDDRVLAATRRSNS